MKAPKNPLFPSKINLKHTARSKQYRAAAAPLTQPAGHRRFSSLCSALPPEALPGHGPPIAGERGWARPLHGPLHGPLRVVTGGCAAAPLPHYGRGRAAAILAAAPLHVRRLCLASYFLPPLPLLLV